MAVSAVYEKGRSRMNRFIESSPAARSLFLVMLFFTILVLLIFILTVSDWKIRFTGILLMGGMTIGFCVLRLLHQHPEKAVWISVIWNVPLWVWWAGVFGLLFMEAMLFYRSYRKEKKQLSAYSVKEALDRLPMGICFFDVRGLPVLSNVKMNELVFALSGKDIQCRADLEALCEDGVSGHHAFWGESVWRFCEEEIKDSYGRTYVQITASDITKLYKKKQELEADTGKCREMTGRMETVLKNISEIIREEEILNLKMRVHDDTGRGLAATRKLVLQKNGLAEAGAVMTLWKNALNLLKQEESALREKDTWMQLETAAAGIGVKVSLKGCLPKNEKAAYLMVSAMRECVTNTVRHAGGNTVYAVIEEQKGQAEIKITNNGKAPETELIEGGGLSGLRKKTEKMGGEMKVKSFPEFCLSICVPVIEEEEG